MSASIWSPGDNAAAPSPPLMSFAPSAGSTDHTAAFQAAVTAAVGAILILWGDDIVISDAITIPSDIKIISVYGTSITAVDLPDGGVGYRQRMFDIRDKSNVCIDGVTFDGSQLPTSRGGMRCILATGSSNYTIEHCKFITPGAAVASVNCHDYRILHNDVTIASTTGAAWHDGIIDNWDGSHDFTILDNHIDGNNIGLWPILVTGENSASTAAACYNFKIIANTVIDCRICGIWAMGRSGTVYDFTIADNTVDGISEYYGLAITDAHDFTATGNTLKNTALTGIRLFSETSEGGTTGAVAGNVSANTIVNANTLNGSTANSLSSDAGSAISVTDNSSRISVADNVISGTTHRYAVFLGTNTTKVEVDGRNYATGVVGVIKDQATYPSTNTVPGSNAYTPTLVSVANVTTASVLSFRFERSGNRIYYNGRLSVTPAVAVSTDTQLSITLPVASNFTDASQASGVASTSFGLVASVFADASDVLILRFPAPNTSANIFHLSGDYEIL